MFHSLFQDVSICTDSISLLVDCKNKNYFIEFESEGNVCKASRLRLFCKKIL